VNTRRRQRTFARPVADRDTSVAAAPGRAPRGRAGGDVVVTRVAVDSARRGHPWIYASSVASAPEAATAIVRVVTTEGEIVGGGVHDAASPIAVRMWTVGERRLDAALFRERLARAIAVRHALFADGTTTAYRLLHGEGDRTPGFVIDRYGPVAVLKIDGDGARSAASELLRDLEPLLRGAGIETLLERIAAKGQEKEVVVRFGPPASRVEVREHGIPMVVDLLHGQKTGAFLDQRDNRRRVGAIVARRRRAGLAVRVLNLFSYTGGFSLHAALEGGTVTSVDIAARAHATAQESFRRAGVDPSTHTFTAADAFAFLERAKGRGETWDVVISDPPSFAPSERAKPKAISAYRALHRACAAVLAPAGTFVAASCSSHVTLEDLASTLDDLTLGRNDLRLLELHGPPPDHPTLPAFPEGRYLKLAVLE
jgi:23S rRNA (cytosine1962-C5)-methyltransferase